MSPRVKPKPRLPELSNWRPEVKNPTPAEFRSEVAKGEFPHAFSEETALWKYLLSPETVSPLGGTVPLLSVEEHRVLSKASGPVGGYLVDQAFDDKITAARRARAVIGSVAREMVTSDGTTMLLGTTSTHGVATWTAESAPYTASDEVFGQGSISAFKASTLVIWSEDWRETPLSTSRPSSPMSSASASLR